MDIHALMQGDLRAVKQALGLPAWRPPMPVARGVQYVLRQLDAEDIAYAQDHARGDYRGFAALHDRCDANMRAILEPGKGVGQPPRE